MILDTNAISSLISGDPRLEVVLAVSLRHHLPVVALGEYRFGLRASKYRHVIEPLLDRLEQESQVLAVTAATAQIYADVRHELKVAGHPIPENDVWIAAIARQHNLPIVSRDEHLRRVKGVTVIAW